MSHTKWPNERGVLYRVPLDPADRTAAAAGAGCVGIDGDGPRGRVVADPARGVGRHGVVVFTDSETWAGAHPVPALRQYRERTGLAAKLVVMGLVSDGFSIAEPNDAGMLDVVGFDTAAPAVIADFFRQT